MKINVFSYVFWPEYFLINELTEELARRGHDIAIQTSLPNYQSGNLAENFSFFKGPYTQLFHGSKVFRYPVVPRKKSFVFLAFNYASNIIMGFFNLFRLPKADVYFFFATSPLLFILPVVLLKKMTKKPLVIWYQDLWPDSFFAVTGIDSRGFLLRILNPFIRFIYKNTDLMLLQSPAFSENLNRYDYRGRTEIVYNWAPEFQPLAEKVEWVNGLPADKFIITFAGNIGKVQALDHLIEAAITVQVEMPQVHFALVGEGSYLPDLKKKADQLCLKNIGFYGRKPINDMPALFQRSDALLVSLKDDPTFNTVVPSKIQAYMTSGKPIIAFLNGVGAEVVSAAKCGVVVSADDSLKLVEGIKELLALAPSERLEMGENGKNFFKQNFEKKMTIDKLERLLIETIGKAEQ